MSVFSQPLGMNFAQQVGFDELGRPLYELPTGGVVGAPMPEQNRLSTVLRTEVDPFTGRAVHYQDEFAPTATGNALSALFDGVWSGISAPGRAASGEPVTLGDAWATALDWGALAAPMPAPAGAVRAGAMRSAGEGPADEIARMLREGRASEITDDMMAALSPEDNARLFRLYEEGATGQPMPMDEASRMARAREMGFDTDTPMYHATGEDFTAFDDAFLGQVTSQNATDFDQGSWANNLAMSGHWLNDQPLAAFLSSPIDMPVYTAGDLSSFSSLDHLSNSIDEAGGVDAFRAGHSGTRGGYSGFSVSDEEMGGMSRVIMDPRNIRSRFARFDPRLSHLAHLSAGGAGAALMLDREAQPQPAENAIMEYLRSVGALQ